MDWEQIQYLRDCIQEAIGVGMRDGFASQEKQAPVEVHMPKPIEVRDFFAGCALIGIVSRHEPLRNNTSEICYELADAMLLTNTGQTPESADPHA